MESLYHSCQGFSHKSSDKPCQDSSFASSSNALSMAIVSDGHGGARYFRSDVGSKLLVEITKESVKTFTEGAKEIELFKGCGMTQWGVEELDIDGKAKIIHSRMNWLVSSIISQWNIAISQHAVETPLTEWEQANVDPRYLHEFEEIRNNPEASLEKTYGCTLMAYVQTPDFWIAFQIGDGKMVFFNVADEKLSVEQLVPWDEKCFLNKTTSICDSDAVNEFRYAFEGNGHFPSAVFLGSDGIDDTFGDGDLLSDFYIKLYKLLTRKGKDATLKDLKRDLPKLSKIGSKDDMSIALVYDEIVVDEVYFFGSEWQIERLTKEVAFFEDKISEKQKEIEAMGDEANMSDKEKINLRYANMDIEAYRKRIGNAQKKLKGIASEDGKFKAQLKRGFN